MSTSKLGFLKVTPASRLRACGNRDARDERYAGAHGLPINTLSVTFRLEIWPVEILKNHESSRLE